MDELDEPTELTAMTGSSHEVEGGNGGGGGEGGGGGGGTSSCTTGFNSSSINNNSNYSNNNNNIHSGLVAGDANDGGGGDGGVLFGRDWLKRQLHSPAGKCLFLVAVLGLSVLAAYLGSKIVLGGLFMHECPEEPFVPIYLVVSSSIFIVFMVVLLVIFFKCRHRYEEEESISPIYLLSLVYAFLHLVLQLAGSVCIIRTFNRYDADADVTLGEGEGGEGDTLCNNTLLTYAFGVVVFELILSSIFFLLSMALLCQVIYTECCQSNHKATHIRVHS